MGICGFPGPERPRRLKAIWSAQVVDVTQFEGNAGWVRRQTLDDEMIVSILRRGDDLTILAAGIMVHRTLEVIDDLGRLGVDAGAVDLYPTRPLNEDLLLEAVVGPGCIATLEENCMVNGIGTAVCEAVADRSLGLPVPRLGAADAFSWGLGGREVLQARDDLDRPSIVAGLQKWVERSGGTT